MHWKQTRYKASISVHNVAGLFNQHGGMNCSKRPDCHTLSLALTLKNGQAKALSDLRRQRLALNVNLLFVFLPRLASKNSLLSKAASKIVSKEIPRLHPLTTKISLGAKRPSHSAETSLATMPCMVDATRLSMYVIEIFSPPTTFGSVVSLEWWLTKPKTNSWNLSCTPVEKHQLAQLHVGVLMWCWRPSGYK